MANIDLVDLTAVVTIAARTRFVREAGVDGGSE
jgi:hypothetical protein